MVADQAGKKVCVISDSDLLFDVIKVNLEQCYLAVERCEPGARYLVFDKAPVSGTDFDLILVASSSPSSEPLVSLFKAALTEHIGQTPILIISDRKFQASQEGRIYHLDFPFDPDELCGQVRALLDRPEELDR